MIREDNAIGSGNNETYDDRILHKISEIDEHFSRERCLEIIGDPDKANTWIQDNLRSTDLDVLSYATMPHFYRMYQNGEIDGDDLMSQLESLFKELDRELHEFADMVLFGIAIPTM